MVRYERIHSLNPDVKRLARQVASELENTGHAVSFDEMRAILAAEAGTDQAGFRCASCGNPLEDVAASACPKCGGTKAVETPYNIESFYCRSCGVRLDAELKSCPRCGGTEASRQSPLQCERCGEDVGLEDTQCSSCGHTRAIPRSGLR